MQAIARAHWPWLLIAAYGVQLIAVVYGAVWHIDRPLSGLYPHEGPNERQVHAMATSAEGTRVKQGLNLELLAINGRAVCETPAGPRCGVAWARSLLDLSPGATNTFVLDTPANGATTFVLTVGPGEVRAVMGWARYSFVITTIGLIYTVIGIVVWRRSRKDPAALPFLLFSLAMGSTLAGPVNVDAFTLSSRALTQLSSWILMAFLFLFVHSFATGTDASRTFRFRALLVVCLSAGGVASVSRVLTAAGVWGLRPFVDAPAPLLITTAIATMAFSLRSTWRAARPPSPLSHRRRARVLALAVMIAFGYPIAWLILQERINDSGYNKVAFLGLVAAFGAFPTLTGYAMLRHRMFDLRIVVRQGLLYTTLSLALGLAYVAVVFAA